MPPILPAPAPETRHEYWRPSAWEGRPQSGPRLAQGEYVGEPPFGERAEERVPGQLRAAGRWARDAGEESRPLSRRAERIGMVAGERRVRAAAGRSATGPA